MTRTSRRPSSSRRRRFPIAAKSLGSRRLFDETPTTLATFADTNGAGPRAGPIADASGNLYGTTYVGGANGNAAVFEASAVGHALTTLATFGGGNGNVPEAGPAGGSYHLVAVATTAPTPTGGPEVTVAAVDSAASATAVAAPVP